MDAIVPAVGDDTRVRPLSDTRPEPMPTLAGRPTVARVADAAVAAGAGKVAVAIDRRPDAVVAALDGVDGPFAVLDGDNLRPAVGRRGAVRAGLRRRDHPRRVPTGVRGAPEGRRRRDRRRGTARRPRTPSSPSCEPTAGARGTCSKPTTAHPTRSNGRSTTPSTRTRPSAVRWSVPGPPAAATPATGPGPSSRPTRGVAPATPPIRCDKSELSGAPPELTEQR